MTQLKITKVKYTYRLSLILILACYLHHSLLKAQENNNIWNAKWISSYESQGKTNSWIAFRKTFSVQKAIETATIRLAVDSKYWLWINEKMVVYEGGLKRGPNPNDTYYDELDVSGYLKNGENIIAVLVWYFGKNGFSHVNSGKSGLIAELYLNGKLFLETDRTWMSRPHSAYLCSFDGEQPNYRLPESNVIYDARKEFGNWKSYGYTANYETGWDYSHVHGKGECIPWNKLVKRPVPQWKDYGLTDYGNAKAFPFISSGDTIKCKLYSNLQITPYLKVEAEEGKKITVQMDNYRLASAVNVRAEYITKKGKQEYESYGWMNGHEVYYIIPEGIEVLDLKYRQTGYDTEFAGSFQCDDPFFNQLWMKAQRTLYVTMRDGFLDCPDRERAQWWGDVVNEMGECFYALCPKSHLLCKKAINELTAWQREDSVLFSPVPAGNWSRELPTQMLNSTGYFGFWNYYLHTADSVTIKDVFPQVIKYMHLWQLDKNGFVVERPGDWTWLDWGNNLDTSLLYNTWFYISCKGYALMAEMLNMPNEKEWAENNMGHIKAVFNEYFWNGQEYRSPGHRGETDERGNALAVMAGLAEPEKFPAIKKVLKNNYNASPYMEKYIVQSLYEMGYANSALERLKSRFSVMVNSYTATLWEGWGLGAKGWGGGSYNHAWSGGGLTLLSQYAAGICPIGPGYSKIKIRPQMGYLKKTEAKLESVAGVIHLKNSFDSDNVFVQDIHTPTVSKIFLIPPFGEGHVKSIRINGVFMDVAKIFENDGLSLDGGDYLIYYVLK